MNGSLPNWFFGGFLFAFVSAVIILAWRSSLNRKMRVSLFILLHAATLVFVLAYIVFEWPRAESQFVEVGQYYSLTPRTTLSLGDITQNPDYIIDRDCKGDSCFKGRVEFTLERKANSPNVLTWNTRDINGTFRMEKSSGGSFEDGASGVTLTGDVNRLEAVWSLPSENSSRESLVLPVIIELDPKNAPPRIVIEHTKASVVEFPSQRNFEADSGSSAALPVSVYLTSNQLVAIQPANGDGYVPTITVGAADPSTNVNAHLERPTPKEESEGDGFIVNNGLYRTGNPFGHRVYIGAQRGIVATVIASGSAQQWRYAIGVALLWLIPLVFFLPIVGHGGLFVFLPSVQMLLAVRFVLALRAYLWSPYSREAIEGAVLAAVLIPLLIFFGCFAIGVQNVGRALKSDPNKKPWWHHLANNFPPAWYYLVAVIALPGAYLLFQGEPVEFATKFVPAFYGKAEFAKSWIIVILLPLVVWLVALWLDRRLRGSASREGKYTGGANDPITYSVTDPGSGDEQNKPWSWRHAKAIVPALVLGAVVAGAWVFTSETSGWVQEVLRVIVGGAGLLFALSLRKLSLLTQPASRTVAVAVQSLMWVMTAVSILLIVKAIWNLTLHNLGASKAVPDALLPYIPLRTNTLFELMIVVLAVRLLATFFTRWRHVNAPFGRRGFVEIVVIFITPLLMFFISFVASHDAGALLVHWPAVIGMTLIVTGLWPLWKTAAGRRSAISAIAVAAAFVILVGLLFYGFFATNLAGPHSTLSHRVILREGTEAAAGSAETGGLRLIEAIEQNWRMMNYAAEGEWAGRGYGNAPVRGYRTFQYITLSDLVFSVYVLAEHGALGGLALIALYITIFLIVMWMAWRMLHSEPMRLAFVTVLVLMIVFPAIYMAAANVNQWLFTGQDLPLLGLRSRSDIVRSGIVLFLLTACLRPVINASIQQEAASPNWLRLVWYSLKLTWDLIAGGRQRKRQRLESLHYEQWGSSTAIATNIALLIGIVAFAAIFPVIGVARASGNESYKASLDLSRLKERAAKLIKDGHIWFEPVGQDAKAGANCSGSAKNISAPVGVDPTRSYQLCMDEDVRGLAEGDSFAALIRQWNRGPKRADHRGDGARSDERYDASQFFRLDTTLISNQAPQQANGDERDTGALRVNPYYYRWSSPFRPPGGWTGALTEAAPSSGSGGVLVGAGVALPLLAASFNEGPVFVGTRHTPAYLSRQQTYDGSRGFRVYESEQEARNNKWIFEIETISGAAGALLRPGSADFDLFINGCSAVIDSSKECKESEDGSTPSGDTRSAPAMRLDYGDVIAYAPRDAADPKKRNARYIFTYSRAQLGVFSYTAWVNGEMSRVYPQRETWPLAKGITNAIAASVASSSAGDQSVALTLNARLNQDVYRLLRLWRAHLDGTFPIKKQGSLRSLSATLMDSETGALLAMASDDGTPYNPNDTNTDDPVEADKEKNLNLTRHRIGSVVKPFTAAATLRAFPGLHNLTIVDQRSQSQRILGLPIGGRKGIRPHGGTEVDWNHFLPYSDNLYAVTLALLGLCDTDNTPGLPRFTNGRNVTAPLRLILNDRDSSLGVPVWAMPEMFNAGQNHCSNLEKTPLRRQLEELFDVRAGYPQQRSYESAIWSPLEKKGWLSSNNLSSMEAVSPEIPNLALADVRNFDDLRAVLLGGEIGDLPEYGRVGSAWSNVYLAQSFARIATGRRVRAQIVADKTAQAQTTEEWFTGAATAEWRRALVRGLEGVAREGGATAHRALRDTIRDINRNRGIADFDMPYDAGRPRYAVGSGRTYFTVFCKTGTIDPDELPDGDGPLHADSIFVFTAGIWDDSSGRLSNSVTGAIYLEQGTMGQAQELAARLIRLLDCNPRFNWSGINLNCDALFNGARR